MGGVIGHSIPTGDFVATTTLIPSSVKAGVIAGLAALGDRANSTGVALVDDKIIVWNRVANKQETIVQTDAPKTRHLHFRLTAERGRQYQFAYSTNGKNWTELSNASGTHLPPWDRAVRVGLTVGGVKGAEARFDQFQLAPRVAVASANADSAARN
jgi:hypothetical protein